MNPQQKFQIYHKHYLSRTCKVCRIDNSEQFQFIFCDICDDAYHLKCLPVPLTEQEAENVEVWLCPDCQESHCQGRKKVWVKGDARGEGRDFGRKYKCFGCRKEERWHDIEVMTEYLQGRRRQSIKQKNILKKCRHCHNLYHSISCFSKRWNCLNCTSCQTKIRKRCPKSYHQFIKFFIQNSQNIKQLGFHQIMVNDKFQTSKCQRLAPINLKHYQYLVDWQLICRAYGSLFYCLQTNNLQYCNDQLYANEQLMKKNQSIFNMGKTRQLSLKDEQVYRQFKRRSNRFHLPPLQIKQDYVKGFYVAALGYIQPLTLLCEYVGEVSTKRQANKMHVDNDSVMSLIHASTAEESLDITPVRFSGIARFISGIPAKNKELQNVQTLNFCFSGSSFIIFYSIKGIEKGQTLYIDYNQGITQEYPTQHFEV